MTTPRSTCLHRAVDPEGDDRVHGAPEALLGLERQPVDQVDVQDREARGTDPVEGDGDLYVLEDWSDGVELSAVEAEERIELVARSQAFKV